LTRLPWRAAWRLQPSVNHKRQTATIAVLWKRWSESGFSAWGNGPVCGRGEQQAMIAK
jgi:hypothetical protein